MDRQQKFMTFFFIIVAAAAVMDTADRAPSSGYFIDQRAMCSLFSIVVVVARLFTDDVTPDLRLYSRVFLGLFAFCCCLRTTGDGR